MSYAQSSADQVGIPPSLPALPAITTRIEASIEYASKLAFQVENIANRLFGDTPGNGTKSGPSPVPNGSISSANAALDHLTAQLDRLGDAVGHLEFVA